MKNKKLNQMIAEELGRLLNEVGHPLGPAGVRADKAQRAYRAAGRHLYGDSLAARKMPRLTGTAAPIAAALGGLAAGTAAVENIPALDLSREGGAGSGVSDYTLWDMAKRGPEGEKAREGAKALAQTVTKPVEAAAEDVLSGEMFGDTGKAIANSPYNPLSKSFEVPWQESLNRMIKKELAGTLNEMCPDSMSHDHDMEPDEAEMEMDDMEFVMGDPEDEMSGGEQESDIEGLASAAMAAIHQLATAAGADLSTSVTTGDDMDLEDEEPEEELEEGSGDRNDPDREQGHGKQRQRAGSRGNSGQHLQESQDPFKRMKELALGSYGSVKYED